MGLEPPAKTSHARREASVQNRIDELRRQLERKRARRAERTAFFDSTTRAREQVEADPKLLPLLTRGSTSK